MEELKQFLESTSIHGLYFISQAKTYVRLFWTIVVLVGFTVALFLIYESFYNWDQSPISTTIETLPITEVTFPKVTVCPEKNSFTSLNYDIMEADEILPMHVKACDALMYPLRMGRCPDV